VYKIQKLNLKAEEKSSGKKKRMNNFHPLA